MRNYFRDGALNTYKKAFLKRPLAYISIIQIAVIALLINRGYLKNTSSESLLEQLNKETSLEGEVISWPRITKDRTRFIFRTADGSKIYSTIRSAEPSLTRGMKLKVQGKLFLPQKAKNPGGFDFRRYLQSKNIYLCITSERDDVDILRQPGFYDGMISKIRSRMIYSLNRNFSDKNAGVLIQMLVGEISESARELRPYFIDAGVMHVLVISGLNVGYIIFMFWYFFRILGFSRKTAAVVMLPFLWSYIVITGSNPPVVRAAAMATVITVYMLLGRSHDMFQAIGLSAVILLAMNPTDVINPSFQLSYLATFGILYLSPVFQKYFASLPAVLRKPGALLGVSAAAQIFSGPVVAYYFNNFPLIALASNLFVIPIVGIVMAAGMLICLLEPLFHPAAYLVAIPTSLALDLMTAGVRIFSKLPGAGLWVDKPSTVFFVVFYTGALFLPNFRYSKIARYFSIAVILAAVFVTARHLVAHKDFLRITFLEIEGDAVVVEFPNKKNYIIDSGGSFSGRDVTSRVTLPFLRRRNISKIDTVFITALDIPHYGGLSKLAKNIPIGRVYTRPGISTDAEYIDLMTTLYELNIPVNELWAPHEIIEGESKITILNPERLTSMAENNSLVIMIESRGQRVLLTSNIGQDAENQLARKIENTAVLQLPRRRRKSSENFIKKLSPDYAIISNDRESTRRINDVTVYNTFRDGAITISICRKVSIDTFIKQTDNYD